MQILRQWANGRCHWPADSQLEALDAITALMIAVTVDDDDDGP